MARQVLERTEINSWFSISSTLSSFCLSYSMANLEIHLVLWLCAFCTACASVCHDDCLCLINYLLIIEISVIFFVFLFLRCTWKLLGETNSVQHANAMSFSLRRLKSIDKCANVRTMRRFHRHHSLYYSTYRVARMYQVHSIISATHATICYLSSGHPTFVLFLFFVVWNEPVSTGRRVYSTPTTFYRDELIHSTSICRWCVAHIRMQKSFIFLERQRNARLELPLVNHCYYYY